VSGHRSSGGAPRVILDPAIARLIAAMATPPTLRQLGPQDGRTALQEAQQSTSQHSGTVTSFHTAEVGPAGLTGFWVVRPQSAQGPLPVVFYLHGGRWMFGDAGTHARVIGELAVKSDVAVVVPEYSRTPEARYPVALEECYATLLWVHGNAADLLLDPRSVALAGDCAGATLAIALAMLAKARGGPRLRAQLLYYPPTDAACDSASHRDFGEGYLLSSAEQAWYWDQYCDGDRACPTVSPLRAARADLAGLPPTMMVTAEADVVRDEGAGLARKLRAAGVDVTSLRYLGTVHDFVVLSQLADIPPATAAIDQGAWFLAEALRT
jgi:acetyl esterase/lipase